ncbi:helix-turn-helix domain-containing protein [Cohnella thailandensis]|uniref:Helix-turn-helix domain-containing protein n=1 Tax=Cohnella thailandensis TaxID=557557 RepID=A0A841SWV2_9BACL|nr:helix-turn-helix domain-containing protein [Cohnella thailandensis]MBB6634097.1 helix-turn-helix domain-containing protein [Cohnella thailandensis]MBP1972411.1 AraC-like DNA-binding protein [Cohnella thailandensis]
MNVRRFAARKPNKLFLFYFLSFFIVILVPVLLLGVSSYRLAYGSIAGEIRSGNENAIGQTGAALDRMLEEMLSLSIQLGLDGRIYATSQNAESSYLLNDVKDRISSLASEHGYIHSIQIYFAESKTILSSDGPNRKTPGQPIDQWVVQAEAGRSNVLWLPTRSFVNQDGNAYKIATIVVKLPFAFPETTGYVAIHFNEDELNAYLRAMHSDNHTQAYLIDESGAVLSAFSAAEPQRIPSASEMGGVLRASERGERKLKMDGAESLVSVGDPLLNHWRLVSVTPLRYLDDKLSYIRNVILLIGLLLVSLGVVISFFLSRTLYNPIKLLIDKTTRFHKELSATPGKEHSLKDVSDILDQFYSSHRKLESSYNAYHPHLVSRFVNDLLSDKFNESAPEIEQAIAELQLPILSGSFVVMLIEIDDYAKYKERFSPRDLSLLRYAVLNIAQETASQGRPCLSAETGDNRIAVLLGASAYPWPPDGAHTETAESWAESPAGGSWTESPAKGLAAMPAETFALTPIDTAAERFAVEPTRELSALAGAVIESIRRYLPFSVTISFGTRVETLGRVHVSYREAQEAMRHKLWNPGEPILFPEGNVRPAAFEYFYPAHLEKTLANNLRAGNDEEAVRALKEVREWLLARPSLTYENVIRIYNRLVDAMIDVVTDIGLAWESAYGEGNVYQELTRHETVRDLHEWVVVVAGRVAETVRGQTRGSSKVNAAIAFIADRYREDISVERIADAVELTPAYLSRIFKQATGKTVLEYLTRLRIDHSKRLLRETSLTMQDISQQVGYNNANSFIRFFRKHEGITPGEYRKLQEQAADNEASR